MTDKEAMQMALDALENGLPIIEDYGSKEQLQLQHKAIANIYEALRAALAQGEQDTECPYCAGVGCVACDARCLQKSGWLSLTDDEIAEGQRKSWVDRQAWEAAVWWADEKLREKNG